MRCFAGVEIGGMPAPSCCTGPGACMGRRGTRAGAPLRQNRGHRAADRVAAHLAVREEHLNLLRSEHIVVDRGIVQVGGQAPAPVSAFSCAAGYGFRTEDYPCGGVARSREYTRDGGSATGTRGAELAR